MAHRSSAKAAIAAKQNTKERDYWLNRLKLSRETVKTGFPFDYKKRGRDGTPAEPVKFKFTARLFVKLTALSNQSNHTLHVILAAALAALLATYNDHDDIIITTPVYKQEKEAEFINTLLPLRIRVTGDMTFKCLLNRMKQTIVGAIENQNYPVELATDLVFNTVIIVENIHDRKHIRHIHPAAVFSLMRTAESIEGALGYNSLKYNKTTIEKIIAHFFNLLETVLFHIDMPLGGVDILSGEERKQLLVDFNDTKSRYAADKTLQLLFEEQVAKTPGRIAIVGSTQMTYHRLNEQSNQLAHLLRVKGVKPGSIVALIMDRSVWMIIGIMGVLKAGGGYLPIDPEYPGGRIDYMLKDTNTRIVVTDIETVKNSGFNGAIIPVDSREIPSRENTNPVSVNSPIDLAYIIYTSGSTGKPKGVMITHRNAAAYVHTSQKLLRLTPADTRTQQSSFAFDQFVEEVYPVLFAGGKLILLGRFDVQDIEKLREIIEKGCVTVFCTTPAVLNEINRLPLAPALRCIIVGGDVLKKEYISNIPLTVPVYNFYGPTETTVCASHYRCGDDITGAIPIGKPKANYLVYILDKKGRLLPFGVPGEIYISGDGVGRGYLNRPGLTKEKFLPNPFVPQKRMYRTGDLGKFLPGWDIQFLGRIDHQVKIRGFRIELEEIENQMLKYSEIKKAVVVTREEDGDKHIYAYIVLDPARAETGKEFDVSRLRKYLALHLPGYMIPSYFLRLEEVPLTANGKVDKKVLDALAAPLGTGVEYVAPETDMEKTISAIWQEVLNVDKVGVQDNFFEVGGNSLKIVQVSSKLKKIMQKDIPVAAMFRYPTVSALAQYLEQGESDEIISDEEIDGSADRMENAMQMFGEDDDD